jgi:hypothetical protein
MHTAVDAAGTTTADTDPAFTRLPDLASRPLGGGVVWATDELFEDELANRAVKHGGDG